MESFWLGDVKYCIFDDHIWVMGPNIHSKRQKAGSVSSLLEHFANIWTIWTNKTYSTDRLFRAQYTFFVAGGAQPTRRADDDGDYEYGDDEGPKEAQWALD